SLNIFSKRECQRRQFSGCLGANQRNLPVRHRCRLGSREAPVAQSRLSRLGLQSPRFNQTSLNTKRVAWGWVVSGTALARSGFTTLRRSPCPQTFQELGVKHVL